MATSATDLRDFLRTHYRHFNAAALIDAAEGWCEQLQLGNRMFLTLAGAMSTAELGISLAELIRGGKVHGICCTGANLEEDVFNLVAHEHYERVPQYRTLTAEDELALHDRGMNRVTDTCIPEIEAMNCIEAEVLALWKAAEDSGHRRFPHEFLYDLLRSDVLKDRYQIAPEHSWLLAAAEVDLPLFVPGWEDSSLGNVFVAAHRRGELKSLATVKTGLEYMSHLIDWYLETTQSAGLGFFQVGGGIAGDFPICVVPLINQDLKHDGRFPKAKTWSYFCQVSDSTTSYGSYSGAVPNEKITWGKLSPDAPSFIVESDATIVAPLIFTYVLGSSAPGASE